MERRPASSWVRISEEPALVPVFLAAGSADPRHRDPEGLRVSAAGSSFSR